jgi:hypothetical protein
LRQILSWKGFWGVLDRTGLTGLINRSDRFPLPGESDRDRSKKGLRDGPIFTTVGFETREIAASSG